MSSFNTCWSREIPLSANTLFKSINLSTFCRLILRKSCLYKSHAHKEVTSVSVRKRKFLFVALLVVESVSFSVVFLYMILNDRFFNCKL